MATTPDLYIPEAPCAIAIAEDNQLFFACSDKMSLFPVDATKRVSDFAIVYMLAGTKFTR